MVENVWNFVEIMEWRGEGRVGGNYGARCFAQGFVRFELTLCLLVNCALPFVIERVETTLNRYSDNFSCSIIWSFRYREFENIKHTSIRSVIFNQSVTMDITSGVELRRIVTNIHDPVKNISNDIIPLKRSIHTYTPTHVRRHNTWSIPLRISKRRVKRERRMVRFFQYLASGRSWAIVDRQPAVTVPRESSPTEAHIVATLPYARHAFLPSAPNIPKSATATWGHLNKNLMWKVTNSPQLRKKKKLAHSLARSCRVLFRSIFSFLSLCSSANCFSNWLHGVPRSFCSIWFSFFVFQHVFPITFMFPRSLFDKHLETHFAHLEDTSWLDQTRRFETAWRCGENRFRWNMFVG